MSHQLNYSAFSTRPSFGSFVRSYPGWLSIALLITIILVASLLVVSTFHDLIIGLLLAVIGVYIWVFLSWRRTQLLSRFAEDNGFIFTKTIVSPPSKGLFADIGHSQHATNLLQGTYQGTAFQLFDYTYVIGEGRSAKMYAITVCKLNLVKKLPHIFLDGATRALERTSINNDQRLSLEGDFDKYFKLYGPKEYEIEVLSVLNPAVMQMLIDSASQYDIEIVEDELLIYQSGHINKQQSYADIFAVISLLHQSISGSTQHFKMTELSHAAPQLRRQGIIGAKTSAVIAASIVIIWAIVVGWIFLLQHN